MTVSLFVFLIVLSAALQAQFAKTYGGNGAEDTARILTTAGDGFLVVGSSLSTNGAGPWLVKLAAGGSVEWEKLYSVTSHDPFSSVCAMADGGFAMVGGTNSSLWVIKTDGLGESVYQISMANSATNVIYPYAICPGPDSGTFIVGYTMPGPDYDAWVIRLSPDGNVVWQKAFGLGAWEIGVCAAAADDGGLVVAASQEAEVGGGGVLLVFKIDALGVVTWQKSYSSTDVQLPGVRSIRATEGGGFLLAGQGFVLKLGDGGLVEWAGSYYGAGFTAGFTDIRPTSDGGSIVVGDHPSDTSDMLALKLGASGEIEWQKTFGGVFLEIATAVVQTTLGDYAVSGVTTSYGAGSSDLCVLRIPANGEIGTCRFSKGSSLERAALEVIEADVSLSISDTSSTPQAENFALRNTSGVTETYGLCTAQKLLTMSTDPSGAASWTSPGVGSHAYPAGAMVTISAVAQVSPGGATYNYSNWKGDLTNSANPATIEITDDMSIQAQYYEEWLDDPDDEESEKGCFIATAAYRTPLHPGVRLLRRFRDRRLLTNGLGRAFVAAYYRWSPPAARVIAGSPPLRIVVRVLLVPIIAVAAVVLQLGWIPAFLLMAAATALIIKRNSLRRRARPA